MFSIVYGILESPVPSVFPTLQKCILRFDEFIDNNITIQFTIHESVLSLVMLL